MQATSHEQQNNYKHNKAARHTHRNRPSRHDTYLLVTFFFFFLLPLPLLLVFVPLLVTLPFFAFFFDAASLPLPPFLDASFAAFFFDDADVVLAAASFFFAAALLFVFLLLLTFVFLSPFTPFFPPPFALFAFLSSCSVFFFLLLLNADFARFFCAGLDTASLLDLLSLFFSLPFLADTMGNFSLSSLCLADDGREPVGVRTLGLIAPFFNCCCLRFSHCSLFFLNCSAFFLCRLASSAASSYSMPSKSSCRPISRGPALGSAFVIAPLLFRGAVNRGASQCVVSLSTFTYSSSPPKYSMRPNSRGPGLCTMRYFFCFTKSILCAHKLSTRLPYICALLR
mmetsp:Transcript_46864/g.74980  ORF Transcript_46864/g.74980 Transcript_46864/m.74980 type:complete len:340 (-) Transcript_46864:54-1073(-)